MVELLFHWLFNNNANGFKKIFKDIIDEQSCLKKH